MKTIIEVLSGLNVWSVAFRLGLAVILGGLIGLERGRHGRAAGLRTHILVSLGAAVSALIGLYAVVGLGITCDPLRAGAQVVSGIGFLGVGTIVVNKSNKVTGLTTAAGLWATACVGLAIGIGFYEVAFISFVIIFVTMAVFIYLEKSIKIYAKYNLYIEISNVSDVNTFYNSALQYVNEIQIVSAKSGLSGHVGLELSTNNLDNYDTLKQMIANLNSIEISVPMIV